MTMLPTGRPARAAILVVDDEPDILTAIEDLMEDLFDVHKAGSGAEGLALLAAHPEVAVIVSDQRMPQMPGDRFLEVARQSSDAGTILVTGYADLSAVVSAVNRGGISGYLAKPWEPATLKSLIASVAERCLIARDLALERALLHGLLEGSADRISFKDHAGRFLRLNSRKAAQLGRPVEACLGLPEDDIAARDPAEAAADRAALGDGGSEVVVEQQGADGRPVALRVGRTPLAGPGGAGAYLMTTERDITEERLVEARLRQAEKMQALGTLAGGIAHDFNNLLTAIIGGLELAERRLPGGDERLHRLVTGARDAAERGAVLTKRLLGFTRQSDQKRRSVDVNGLVAGMADLMRHAVGSGVRLEQRPTAGSLPVVIDPDQLELAILNLCVNARDAMPEGGRVTVTTAEVAVAAGGDLGPGRYVSIAVADTGTGIPPEVLARVFEPFFTTKEPGKGTGLGLSMAYTLATSAGGDVRIETEPGRGTTVEIRLPKADGPAEEAAPEPAVAAATPRPGRILVVDDDRAVRAVTASYLRGMGHQLVEADGGTSALDILDSGVALDLMVVDYAMPAMNGVDLAAAARRRRPDLPVLFITGYADEKTYADMPDFINKPFRESDLRHAVARLLDGPA